jgi:hypothetical protein
MTKLRVGESYRLQTGLNSYKIIPKLFLTKVWGFDPEIYPTLGFRSDGGRLNFLRASSPGDWVVLLARWALRQARRNRDVGTGRNRCRRRSSITWHGIPTNQYNADGTYRWPFGLPIISALRFPDKPTLLSVLESNLSGSDWATYVYIKSVSQLSLK